MSEALKAIGKLLMERVRDEAIEEWDKIIDGKLQSDRAVTVQECLRDMTPAQIAVIKIVLPQVVDSCLHHLLWTLEQAYDVEIRVRIDNSLSDDIKSLSDGLAGELYGSKGWIAKFSRQRHVPPV